jgi:nitroreductase
MAQTNDRKTGNPVASIFPNRWSPRAMSGESITDQDLMSLFEAARWAPSCFNGQPWRFLYAKRDSDDWPLFVSLMNERNQSWASKAAVLVVVVSNEVFEHNGEPNRTHTYDAGAAWGSLALQGSMNGLVVHGMAGFDYQRAKTELELPDDFTVQAMAAIGKPGDRQDLPEPMRKMEAPNDRKPVAEIAIAGKFRA